MSWTEKLKKRWKLKSGWQLLLILVVFACTGLTVAKIGKYVKPYFIDEDTNIVLFYLIYFIASLPIYYVFLLFYGFLFGQFDFFWNFVKKTFSRFSKKKQ